MKSINALFSLRRKVALVTGARRGIGRAIALQFAGAGADVAVCDIVMEDGELDNVNRAIKQAGRRSLAIQADVSRNNQVEAMVQRVQAELGPIDILVNDAVYFGSSNLESRDVYWDNSLNVNLTGYKNCVLAVVDGMMQRQRGNVINLASIAGLQGEDAGMKLIMDAFKASGGAPAELLKAMMPRPYNVTKAGIIMLTRVLAKQLAPHGIRVNAIAPGATRTGLIDFLLSRPDYVKKWEAEIPMGRLAEPEEIAAAALFLASDASSYVTGHTLVADGGVLA